MNSSDQRLPLTVITGYLGAGKTTLVNHMLRHAGGRRIMVLVNDFGDIAIDADLIESQDGDTLTLANGCICCSMGGDLFYALSDALDRQPRPDHLLIEASGVADPTRISETARAEPDLRLDGTIAVVDAVGFADRVADSRIGSSVVRQVAAADLIVITKSDLEEITELAKLKTQLAEFAPGARQLDANFGQVPLEVLLGGLPSAEVTARAHACSHHDHPDDHEDLYLRWSISGDFRYDRQTLRSLLENLPAGLLRLKGIVQFNADEGLGLVQVVGRRAEITSLSARFEGVMQTNLVAIGLKGQMEPADLDRLFA